MTVLLSLFLPALAADCSGGACPKPRDTPVITASPDAQARPAPIDQLPATHLRTATFALG